MHRYLFLLLLATVTLGAGCARGVYGTVGVGVTVPPGLVYVAPGVYAVPDRYDPIFYADGYYWWHSGVRWYRSPFFDRGWRVAPPPRVIVRLDRPYRYRYLSDGRRVVIDRRDVRQRPVSRGLIRVRPSPRIERPVQRPVVRPRSGAVERRDRDRPRTRVIQRDRRR